jgi:hypothetical protein
MIRKAIGVVLILLAVGALFIGSLIHGASDMMSKDYAPTDIYALSEDSFSRATDISITVDLVVVRASAPPMGEVYAVASKYADDPEDGFRIMMVMASSPETKGKLNALLALFQDDPESVKYGKPVVINGYIGELPDNAREEIIKGVMADGVTKAEATELYDNYFMPFMFVEESTMTGLTNGMGIVLIVVGIIMAVIAIVLFITAKNAGTSDNGNRGYRHGGGDYQEFKPIRRDTTSMNTGGYQSPSGNRGYQSPPGSNGNLSPSGNRGYQSPNAGYRSPQEDTEPEVPFNPNLFKPRNYDEFFAPKKKKVELETVTAEGSIDDIVRKTNDDPKAVIAEVKEKINEDSLPVKKPYEETAQLPDVPLYSLHPADDEIFGAVDAPPPPELLDFDNAQTTQSNDSDKESALHRRADFWSKWELDDADVRVDTELPAAKSAGPLELGAVDEISVSADSFGSLREAPPEPEEIDYFAPAATDFDMDLDEYLKTDFLEENRED